MSKEDNRDISIDLNEKIRKEELKKLRNLIHKFLKGKDNDIALYFENPLRINENEFENLIGHYNSSRSFGDNGNIEEEYVYVFDNHKKKTDSGKCEIPIKRLFLNFHIEEDDNNDKITYILHYAKGLSEKIEIDCNRLQ